MTEVDVQIVYLDHYNGGDKQEKLHYKHEGDSGMDLRASIPHSIVIEPRARVVIPSGVKMACPIGTEIQIRPRSGTALKKGLNVGNSPGTIDACYRGEIGLICYNMTNHHVTVDPGERIAQAVVMPVLKANLIEVGELDDTTRGEGAFNSTGTK